MPVPTLPVAAVSPGNVLTSTMWNAIVKDSVNKLLNQGHRVLTVAQFAALTGLEGTKGTVAPDEVYLEVDSTNGIQWHLAYESGEPTYKWRFLGGPPMRSSVATSEGVGSLNAWVNLTTNGPIVVTPRAGDYGVQWSSFTGDAGSVINSFSCAVALGDVTPGSLAARRNTNDTVQRFLHVAQKDLLTAVPITTSLKVRYFVATGGNVASTFADRWLEIRPVRLS